MAGLCEGGNEPPGSLKASKLKRTAIPSLNLTAPSSENMGQSTMKEPRRSPKKRIRPSIEEATGSPIPDRNDDSPLPGTS
ncbi:hypothetical protein ANN_19625 [Periplaneta americana]|uniref:Uncharacterized protein n=1 Tax=Periplaneta americana TaxID=6978 RepID=A0ABQ8SBG4_PERAM|nr:hypothetical protein ANN_19625 [Periplaneta americana]